MEFNELVEQAIASADGYTQASQALRLAAAAGEIAGTFAVPIGIRGDGKALAIAIGKTAMAAIGVAHIFNEPVAALIEPKGGAEADLCGEDIVGELLASVAKTAQGPWPEDTQEVLELLAALAISIGLPSLIPCWQAYIQHSQ